MAETTPQQARGRPREFDEREVLEYLVEVFWTQGFRRSTFADFEDATGVHRHSLQKAFGTKHEIFERVLRHYADTRALPIMASFGRYPDDPLRSLRETFQDLRDMIIEAPSKGCLLLNTCGELAQVAPQVVPYIEKTFNRVIDAMRDTIARAQELGQLDKDVEARVLAASLFTSLQGIVVTNKVFQRAEFVRSVFDGMLAQLRPKG